jgi:hypothetical protein
MIRHAKAVWHEFAAWPSGVRFRRFHRAYAERCTMGVKCALVFGALISFALGVVEAFMPGPAVLFFTITAGCVALLSPWVARRFDVIELRLCRARRRWKQARARKAERRRQRPGEREQSWSLPQPH